MVEIGEELLNNFQKMLHLHRSDRPMTYHDLHPTTSQGKSLPQSNRKAHTSTEMGWLVPNMLYPCQVADNPLII